MLHTLFVHGIHVHGLNTGHHLFTGKRKRSSKSTAMSCVTASCQSSRIICSISSGSSSIVVIVILVIVYVVVIVVVVVGILGVI